MRSANWAPPTLSSTDAVVHELLEQDELRKLVVARLGEELLALAERSTAR